MGTQFFFVFAYRLSYGLRGCEIIVSHPFMAYLEQKYTFHFDVAQIFFVLSNCKH